MAMVARWRAATIITVNVVAILRVSQGRFKGVVFEDQDLKDNIYLRFKAGVDLENWIFTHF